MNTPTPYIFGSAADVRDRLDRLRAEEAAAALAGLEGNATYMADLHEDISLSRQAYVAAAVTEIATLRGQLGGPLVG